MITCSSLLFTTLHYVTKLATFGHPTDASVSFILHTTDIIMAAAKVFHTVELLETILFQLPANDALVFQRVSKAWKHTVEGSRTLQRALFFEPALCGPAEYNQMSQCWR